jgi:hypothetical protein
MKKAMSIVLLEGHALKVKQVPLHSAHTASTATASLSCFSFTLRECHTAVRCNVTGVLFVHYG